MLRDLTIFIVDDTRQARALLENIFHKDYWVESFARAEDCLARLNEHNVRPDIFLLDVNLPGMSGYELCRQIKSIASLTAIPVIFISGLDDLESRLEGYSAGGTDYVVKPYNVPELRQKVITACRDRRERLWLDNRMHESETLTSLILSNLDEYAVLIKFLRSLNDCDKPASLLHSLFGLLCGYQLECAIQLRLQDFELTVSADGENRPLEMAVINHVRDMGRIFEFKTRGAYNFRYLTVLVNNMPCHDPERCGRLRDHLAIAAECANSKLESLQTRADYAQAQGTAGELLTSLQTVVLELEKKHSMANYRGTLLTEDMLDELARAFASLGLSDDQEFLIDGIVRKKVAELAEIHDSRGTVESALNEVAVHLEKILHPTMSDATPKDSAFNAEAIMANNATVELF